MREQPESARNVTIAEVGNLYNIIKSCQLSPWKALCHGHDPFCMHNARSSV